MAMVRDVLFMIFPSPSLGEGNTRDVKTFVRSPYFICFSLARTSEKAFKREKTL